MQIIKCKIEKEISVSITVEAIEYIHPRKIKVIDKSVSTFMGVVVVGDIRIHMQMLQILGELSASNLTDTK